MKQSNLNRRSAIAAMAAAPIAGAGTSTLVQASTNPIREAYRIVMAELNTGVPEGMKAPADFAVFRNNFLALAYPPDWKPGMPSARYDEAQMRWLI